MKTSELKRILSEDLVETFSENEDVIFGVYWTVKKREQRLRVFGVIPLNVLKALGEYVNTPIEEREEREEEKKYYFKFYDGIDNTISDRFLKLDESDKVFYFSDSYRNKFYIKGLFTEKEIENFPPEIKGAIECGFLKKVEVSE